MDFVDQVDGFIAAVNGGLTRWPIAKGSAHGAKAVKEAITAELKRLTDDHLDAVDKLDLDQQDRCFESRANEITATRYKIEAYAQYLGDQAIELNKLIAQASDRLRSKVLEAAALEAAL
jgi:hypothetical protein